MREAGISEYFARVAHGRPAALRLLTCLFFLATLSLSVVADPSDDELSQLKAATRYYQEGAFDLARDRAAALLKKYPKTELLPQVELLQAKALYQLGRSADALAALTLPPEQAPEDLRSDLVFWQAESLLDLNRWPEAEKKYRLLLALKNTPERQASANLGLAWALFKQGKETEVQSILQILAKENGKMGPGQQAQLLLAKMALIHGQYKEAIAGLQSILANQPAPALSFQTSYLLGQAYDANGQPELAAKSYQQVTGVIAPDNPTAVDAFPKPLVAQAYLGLGKAEHELHQDDLAMLAYGQAFQLTENDAVQMAAFRAFLDSARAAGQLPEGVTKLQDFAKTSTAAAPAALLATASALAQDHQEDKAIGILESVLIAYGKSEWIPATNYQLGLLYAQKGKGSQAIAALQNCLNGTADVDLQRAARFQLGLVMLNQVQDYAGAVAQFEKLSPGTDAQAENATYSLLLAQAALKKTDAFLKTKADFVRRFPKSAYLKKIALAQGQLLVQANEPQDAIAVYQQALAQPGGGAGDKALLLALADLQYQTGDLAGTVETCRLMMKRFPQDSLLAAQRAILISYEMKKLTDDQAEQALVALMQKTEKVPGAAEAWFRLGDFYFYRQDYVKAQDAFQQLTSTYPESTQAPQAYFFAGRAAAAHTDYDAALALLDKVPDGSPLKAEALLWEGRVDQERHDFLKGCTQADAVLATEKTGSLFVGANILKGECFFELGSKDPSNYGQALAAFDQILKGKEGTPSERSEASVRSAKCLEKMGRPQEALARYLDVLYGPTAEAGAGAPADYSWEVKAGWEASRMREAQQDWRGAIEIYKRLEQIGGPHQQEFHDLQNKLRRDNYIYE